MAKKIARTAPWLWSSNNTRAAYRSGRRGDQPGVTICDGFSHVVSNKSTMQVNRKTSYFCMQDKEPLLLRGHTRAGT
jgi:hypothetical protein